MKQKTHHSFEQKWSKAIHEHGFTAIPNLLFSHRKELGLTAPEFFVLAAIETFRWSVENPWPSLEALRRRTGYTPRTLSRTISSLQRKGLVKRIRRTGTSNMYSLEPLVHRLDQIAISVLPPGKDRPPGLDKTSSTGMTSVSSKEYAAKDTQEIKTTKNNGVKSIEEILKERKGFGNEA